LRKLGELTNNDAFGSWLKRIVINNCLTHLRHNKFQFDDIHDYAPAEFPNDEETELNLDPAVVHDAIKELPKGGRTVLVLHALEGYNIVRLLRCWVFQSQHAKLNIREPWKCSPYNLKIKYMSVKLEKYLLEQRNKLDVESPDDDYIWKGIEKGSIVKKMQVIFRNERTGPEGYGILLRQCSLSFRLDI